MTAREFWEEYCRVSAVDPATPYQVWYFGNEVTMARELAKLVLSSKNAA